MSVVLVGRARRAQCAGCRELTGLAASQGPNSGEAGPHVWQAGRWWRIEPDHPIQTGVQVGVD